MTHAALTFSPPGAPPLTGSSALLSAAHRLDPQMFHAHATLEGQGNQTTIGPLLIEAERELQRQRADTLIIAGSGGTDEETALIISATKLGLKVGLVMSGTESVGEGDVPPAARLADLLVVDQPCRPALESAGLAPRTRTESSEEPAVAIVEEWLEQGAPRGDRGYGITR